MNVQSPLSEQPKKKLVAAIVGPSVGSGILLGLALSALDRHYPPTGLQLFSFAIELLLSGMMLYIAIGRCKKVMKLLP